MTFTNISQSIKDALNLNNWVESVKTHAPNISAETLGWLAVIVLHLATVPTMAAVLTGLTVKMTPFDLVLFTCAGLFLLFCKATIQRDLLNIVTIGFGFFIQASFLALIVFK